MSWPLRSKSAEPSDQVPVGSPLPGSRLSQISLHSGQTVANLNVELRQVDADRLREALAQAGAGRIGDYDSASFSSPGEGRFRPLDGASPAIGEVGRLRRGGVLDSVRPRGRQTLGSAVGQASSSQGDRGSGRRRGRRQRRTPEHGTHVGLRHRYFIAIESQAPQWLGAQ